mmetsp:Transcript_53995/g.99760  ORF Transcript_53995/g.99760 Transcript_53995/m.99760 type:complete len:99 (+) Transcript_53995:321-617(+)
MSFNGMKNRAGSSCIGALQLAASITHHARASKSHSLNFLQQLQQDRVAALGDRWELSAADCSLTESVLHAQHLAQFAQVLCTLGHVLHVFGVQFQPVL